LHAQLFFGVVKMKDKKSVGRIISCIHRLSYMNLHKKLEKYNIGPGQLHFLMMLYNHDHINQECLAHRLLTDKATSARAIKKLEEEGFVKRLKDEKDRRAYNIILTEKALKLRPIIKKTLFEWTDTLLTDFTEDDKKSLFEKLEKIKENAQNGIEKLE